jgi:hypothetical protein
MVYIGNWAGCLITSYFFGYLTDIFASEGYRSYLYSVTLSKLEEHGQYQTSLSNYLIKITLGAFRLGCPFPQSYSRKRDGLHRRDTRTRISGLGREDHGPLVPRNHVRLMRIRALHSQQCASTPSLRVSTS